MTARTGGATATALMWIKQLNKELVPGILNLLYPILDGMEWLLRFFVGDRDVEAAAFLLIIAGVLGLLLWFITRCGRGDGAAAAKLWEWAPICASLFVFCTLLLMQYPRGGLLYAQSLELESGRIASADGFAVKYRLKPKETAQLRDQERAWIYEDGRLLPSRVPSVEQVKNAGAGSYLIRDGHLYFSAANNSDPRANHSRYALHFDRRGAGWIFVSILFVTLASLLPFALLLWRACAPAWCVRAAVLPWTWHFWWPGIAVAAVFFVFYFGQQWVRFSGQDLRMQTITSHPDDGCMLQRIRDAAEKKTMDPWEVKNGAYGAVAYYPFAMPSVMAAKLGFHVSDRFITMSVRGLKTLLTALGLLALYAMGAKFCSRAIGVVAAILMATSADNLLFGSMPFYPDALMGAVNTLGLIYALALVERHSGGRLFLACVWCGIATGIKYLAGVSLPFIVVCSLIGRMRAMPTQRWRAVRLTVGDGFFTAAVFGLAFISCNPYLDYFRNWIIPNVTRASDTFSYASVSYLNSSGASIDLWKSALYGSGNQDKLLMLCAVLGVVWMLWKTVTKRAGDDDLVKTKRFALLLLFGYCVVFVAFLIKSITLSGGISGRLLFIVRGPLYLAALMFLFEIAACLSLCISASAARTWALRGFWAAIFVLLLFGRMEPLSAWARYLGAAPTDLPVAAWLKKNDVPHTASVVGGLYPYVPQEYPNYGGWQMIGMPEYFQKSSQPCIYVESKSWVDEMYLVTRQREEMATDQQWATYRSHRLFYGNLRAQRIAPFIFVSSGREQQSSAMSAPVYAEFNLFVNRYLLTPSVLAPANGAVIENVQNFVKAGNASLLAVLDKTVTDTTKPVASGLHGQWPQSFTIALKQPTVIEMLHLAWLLPNGVPSEFIIEGQTAQGEWRTLVKQDTAPADGLAWNYYRVAEREPLTRIRFTAKSAIGFDHVQLTEIAAYAASPQCYNNTLAHFELNPEGAWAAAAFSERLLSTTKLRWPGDVKECLNTAMSPRFSPDQLAQPNYEEDVRSASFTLTPRHALGVQRVQLVFADREHLPDRISIVTDVGALALTKNDIKLEGAAFPYIKTALKSEAEVKSVRITLERDESNPAPLTLRQCYIEPIMPEVK